MERKSGARTNEYNVSLSDTFRSFCSCHRYGISGVDTKGVGLPVPSTMVPLKRCLMPSGSHSDGAWCPLLVEGGLQLAPVTVRTSPIYAKQFAEKRQNWILCPYGDNLRSAWGTQTSSAPFHRNKVHCHNFSKTVKHQVSGLYPRTDVTSLIEAPDFSKETLNYSTFQCLP